MSGVHFRGRPYTSMTQTAVAAFLIALLPAFVDAQSPNTPQSPQAPQQFYRLPARRVDATLTWHYQ